MIWLKPAILELINFFSGQPRQRRVFAALTTPVSIASYGLLQVKLVWALVTAYRLKIHRDRRPKLRKNLGEFFKFDKKQLSVLGAVSDALEEDSESLNEDLLVPLLNAVYFPTANTTANSIFNSPVIAFIALLCLKEDGSYNSIHLIPPPIAKIQYVMRSVALHTFNTWKKELGPDENEDDWLECVFPFFSPNMGATFEPIFIDDEYLQEMQNLLHALPPGPESCSLCISSIHYAPHKCCLAEYASSRFHLVDGSDGQSWRPFC